MPGTAEMAAPDPAATVKLCRACRQKYVGIRQGKASGASWEVYL